MENKAPTPLWSQRGASLANGTELVEDIYEYEGDLLCEFCVNGVETIATFLGLESSFKKSSEYGALGTSSEKLLSITLEEGGTRYLTGHGARNYLDHHLFEDHNVSVEYIDYPLEQYQQLHGAFDPYVSIIDTIANLGQKLENCCQRHP